MKTIIIYSSQTGFTKKYAQWLAEELDAELMSYETAKKKNADYFDDADSIVYGGWAMAGKIVNSDWFIQRISNWKEKKLALFCVGASPMENPDVDVMLESMLTREQQNYAKAFYCQGGLSYEKMKFPYKLAMKAFASMLNKKGASEKDKTMAEYISHSYDISDPKYINPIVDYIRG